MCQEYPVALVSPITVPWFCLFVCLKIHRRDKLTKANVNQGATVSRALTLVSTGNYKEVVNIVPAFEWPLMYLSLFSKPVQELQLT